MAGSVQPDRYPNCGTCRANRGELPAPGGVIYEDQLWRLEHTFEPVPLVGWLVLKPLRHVEAFADLTPEEAATFGPLVREITSAMREVLRPAKIYLCQFAELENFAHLHFHLIPRFPDTPREHRGAGIFDLLRQAMATGHSLVDVRAAEQAAIAIRDRLPKDEEGPVAGRR